MFTAHKQCSKKDVKGIEKTRKISTWRIRPRMDRVCRQTALLGRMTGHSQSDGEDGLIIDCHRVRRWCGRGAGTLQVAQVYSPFVRLLGRAPIPPGSLSLAAGISDE